MNSISWAFGFFESCVATMRLSFCPLGRVGVMSFVLSILFAADLHFPRFHRIFALAREARKCFPFLVSNPSKDSQPPERGFPCLFWNAIRPDWSDETASFGLSFGLSELPSVAVLQGRLGQVRKLIGRIWQIRRMGRDGKMGVKKLHVRLFLNL